VAPSLVAGNPVRAGHCRHADVANRDPVPPSATVSEVVR